MRKSIDGLMSLVQGKWKSDPYTGHLFVFFGRSLDRVKILFFDEGGFVILYKRLEHGRFKVPRLPPGSGRICLEASDLTMLLRGIDFSKVRRPMPWRPSYSEP